MNKTLEDMIYLRHKPLVDPNADEQKALKKGTHVPLFIDGGGGFQCLTALATMATLVTM